MLSFASLQVDNALGVSSSIPRTSMTDVDAPLSAADIRLSSYCQAVGGNDEDWQLVLSARLLRKFARGVELPCEIIGASAIADDGFRPSCPILFFPPGQTEEHIAVRILDRRKPELADGLLLLVRIPLAAGRARSSLAGSDYIVYALDFESTDRPYNEPFQGA